MEIMAFYSEKEPGRMTAKEGVKDEKQSKTKPSITQPCIIAYDRSFSFFFPPPLKCKGKEKKKPAALFLRSSSVVKSAKNKCGPKTDRRRLDVPKKKKKRVSFQTMPTYCIVVSLFHDNALTPKYAVDLFWAAVIMVLNAGEEPRGGCVQSIRLGHSRASHG